MAHIELPAGLPGISGPLRQYPETGEALCLLAERLLRGPSSLTSAEREMIATFVSSRNECEFCMNSHGAAARSLLGDDCAIVDAVVADYESANVDDKLKALLTIAGKVQQGGRRVTTDDIAHARAAGADDKAIHDTVLIAAAFCMYNRYVDGLDTLIPDESIYAQMGEGLAKGGYMGNRPPA